MHPIHDDEYRGMRRYEELLGSLEKLRGRWSIAETEELASLYRRFTAALARARHRGDDPGRIAALNAVALRGHALLYSVGSQPRSAWPSLLWERAPRVLARTLQIQLFAWSLLLLGAIAGYLAVAAAPENAAALVPESMYPAELLDPLLADAEARQMLLHYGRGGGVGEKSFFASYLFFHNTQVGFLAFTTGILLGLPTMLLQLYNGLVLGAFSALFNRGGISWEFWGWLLPHGVFELTGITLFATAGLSLGLAVLRPNEKTRAESLRSAGPDALLVAGIAIVLLFAAALAESFIRQSHWSVAARLTASALEGAILLLVLILPALRRGAGPGEVSIGLRVATITEPEARNREG